MKKWKIELMMVLAAVVIGGSIWAVVATEPKRKAKAETQKLIDFAQRQALEIVIIEQSVKLVQYKKKIAAAQKPAPIMQLPVIPLPPAPKDIDDSK